MSVHTVTDGQSQTYAYSPLTNGTTEEIDASGASAVDVSVQNGRYPLTLALNLAPSAQVTAAFHLQSLNFLTVNGDATTALTVNAASDLGGAQATINPSVLGTGSFNVAGGGFLDLTSAVASGITVNLAGVSRRDAELKLDQPGAFKGLVSFADSQLILSGLGNATSYGLANGQLTIYGPGNAVLDQVRFNDVSPEQAGLAVRLDQQGEVRVAEQGANVAVDAGSGFLSGTALAQYVPPVTAPVVVPPAQPAGIAVCDGPTGQAIAGMATQAYTGPVQGLVLQFIELTRHHLNIAASLPGMFIHAAGDGAVALSSGTNVVDGGGGSNFMVAGSGADTFFLDARGPAAAIWDTVSNLHSGGAATFWGVSSSAKIDWVDNAGAAGYTGLTLHATSANGSVASLTLAGFHTPDMASGKLSTSFGHDAASNSDYLYVHAA